MKGESSLNPHLIVASLSAPIAYIHCYKIVKIMTLKMKPTNEILLKMLKKEFMKDLRAAKLCASDTLIWVLKNEESIEDYFHKWLINEGYAE